MVSVVVFPIAAGTQIHTVSRNTTIVEMSGEREDSETKQADVLLRSV